MPHELKISAEPGATLTGPLTLDGTAHGGGRSGGGRAASEPDGLGASLRRVAGRQGSLHGVRIEHFYETAVTILGGVWTLDRCEIVSSRGASRACVGVVLRNSSALRLDACAVAGCSCAVLLSSALSALAAAHCRFGNFRAAIGSAKGGEVDVHDCSFDLQNASDVAFRLAAPTVGVVASNAAHSSGGGPLPASELLWGRNAPPHGIRSHA